MSDSQQPTYPPRSVIALLRLEGVLVLVASLAAYQVLGGNWWVFALLILAPDLSMLGMLGGDRLGAKIYNAAHTYLLPGVLAGIAWLANPSLIPLAVIWIAHIGGDRALGYGLKCGDFHHTHLGRIGPPKTRAAKPVPNEDVEP